jgi:hypothetical protein
MLINNSKSKNKRHRGKQKTKQAKYTAGAGDDIKYQRSDPLAVVVVLKGITGGHGSARDAVADFPLGFLSPFGARASLFESMLRSVDTGRIEGCRCMGAKFSVLPRTAATNARMS